MQHHHDETSRALLAAAHRLLAEQGSDALTVRRIANEAGMSTMNVYSRFGGKDGVIDELYIDGFKRLFERLAAVPTTDDIHADLMASANAYRSFAVDNPTYYLVMFRSAINDFTPSDEAVGIALAGLEVFVERVVDGQRRGQIVADASHDAAEVAAWLWATCHGLVSLELTDIATERVAWGSIFETGMSTSLKGLQPTVARQS